MTAKLRASICLALAMSLGLAGCATEEKQLTPAEMLAEANLKAESADNIGAIALYEEIQASHPFGTYAQQSLLNLAFLHFNDRQFDEAIKVADRFIREYPNHANLDYVRYLRAVSLQRDSSGLLEQLILANSGTNSNADLKRAYDAYKEMIRIHPQSKYVPDAIDRINELVDHVANTELLTAIHYLRRGAYGASLRRSSKVITSYPDSTAVETGLAIMIASLVELESQAPKPTNAIIALKLKLLCNI